MEALQCRYDSFRRNESELDKRYDELRAKYEALDPEEGRFSPQELHCGSCDDDLRDRKEFPNRLVSAYRASTLTALGASNGMADNGVSASLSSNMS
jgi:hypothetical protein